MEYCHQYIGWGAHEIYTANKTKDRNTSIFSMWTDKKNQQHQQQQQKTW